VPFIGLQLLEMGATVTRVSPPTDRRIGIDMNVEADLLNKGKGRCTINLKDPAGVQDFFSLLESADVLLEGFRPGVMERLGLHPAQLCQQYPKLVIGRLSGFGRHGDYAPRAGHDINYLALSGVLAAIGTREQPVVPLNLIADFGGGAMHLLSGLLARLVQRGISGKGGIVDTSILAGTFGLTSMLHGLMADKRWNLHRENNILDGGLPFYRVYKTADEKFVAVGALEKPFFKNLLDVLGLNTEFSTESQYNSDTWKTMSLAFTRAISQRSRDQWTTLTLGVDCCMTPVLDFSESVKHPHNIANGWISDHPFPHPAKITEFLSSS